MAKLFNLSIMESVVMFIDYLESPLGLIECKASEKGLRHVIFCGNDKQAIKTNHITGLAKQQLAEYFSSKRTQFSIPLDAQGTDFQKAVWQCLVDIPFGEKCTYGDIAKLLNKPKASQAVGGANGRNPISIIVPCHRVIGSSGKLTGYAGGMLRKQWLLAHEGIDHVKEEYTELLTQVVKTRQSKTNFLT
ncbi:methylated-DNA--[protein]-cysteine S-methyltransferase [Litorilituus lipolyticus]